MFLNESTVYRTNALNCKYLSAFRITAPSTTTEENFEGQLNFEIEFNLYSITPSDFSLVLH